MKRLIVVSALLLFATSLLAATPDQLIASSKAALEQNDPDRAAEVLCALSERGVGVSVDDFGTGNASIEYLADLPASEIKIDRSFITDILRDARAEAIVRSTIDLARNLELSVVAEGIESEAVMTHLAELGCATGQGYFISRPLPPEELTPRLSAEFGLAAAAEGAPSAFLAATPRL